MAFARVQAFTPYASFGTSGTATLSFSAATAGNLLEACVAWSFSGSARTITTPSGWTLIHTTASGGATNCGLARYYKIAAGGETSVAFVCSNSTDYMSATGAEWSGNATSSPVDQHSITQSGTAATTVATPSITPGASGTLAVFAITPNGGGTSTLPGGFTVDGTAGNTVHALTDGHDNTAPTSGSALTVNFTQSSSDVYAVDAVTFLPSSGGTAVPAGAVTVTPRLPTGVGVWVPAGAVLATPPVPGANSNATPPAGHVTVTPYAPGSSFTYSAKVEIAFVANPYGTLSWTDVSAYVTGFETHRGKNYDRGTPEAGTATITLWNVDGRFDPGSTSSPYYPYVLPRVPVRVTVTTAGTTYAVWRGFVERWPQSWSMSGAYTETKITAVDAFVPVFSATMGPRYYDVVTDDLGGGGEYWSFVTTGGAYTTGDDATLTFTGATGVNMLGNVSQAGVSGRLAQTHTGTDYFMRTTWGTGAGTSATVMVMNSTSTVISVPSYEMFFRVHQADSNATHAPVVVYGDPVGAGWVSGQHSLFLVHSATATSGYKLVAGTLTASSTNSLPASTLATYGDLALDTVYHLARVVTANGTGIDVNIYVNGALWYTETATTTSVWPAAGGLFYWGSGTGNTSAPATLIIDLDDVLGYSTTSGATAASATKAKTHYNLAGIVSTAVPDFPSQLTSARVSAVLDVINWPTGDRVIDTGLSTLAASGSVDGRTALDLILEAMNSEMGNVFINGSGQVVFQNRTHRNGASVAITLGDATGEVAYLGDVILEFDDTQILNDVTITQSIATTPATAIRQDATSQTSYGVKSYSASLPLLNSSDCDGMADTLIARYKAPHQRVEKVTVDIASDQGRMIAALAREIGDLARFRRRPPGGWATDINSVIEGIAVKYDSEPRTFTVTFELDPALSNATY